MPLSRSAPLTLTISNRAFFLLYIPLLLFGCDAGGENNTSNSNPEGFNLKDCAIPTSFLLDGGVPRDGIPSLDNVTPGDDRLTTPGTKGARYLTADDRVIGLLFGDEPLAIPENIMWHHEIVNVDDWGGHTFAVTHCPLTGTSLAFDRSAVDGAEFGVSGLLFNNNLVMFDRRENESLWPQMLREARCGSATGTELDMLPVMEMTWGDWKSLHPNTKVISSTTGFSRSYTEDGYPYDDYDVETNDRLLFDKTNIDDRRPPKERVLAIPDGNLGGMAFPFGELENDSPARVINATVGNVEIVVFWKKEARGAMAYRPVLNGEPLSFSVDEDGRFIDDQGRRWTLDGRRADGSARLKPVKTAYVSFWFAWAADTFHPDTRLWTSEE